jgi:hypothetical protein
VATHLFASLAPSELLSMKVPSLWPSDPPFEASNSSCLYEIPANFPKSGEANLIVASTNETTVETFEASRNREIAKSAQAPTVDV